MNCIIIDDEPLAREGIQALVKDNDSLQLMASFGNATDAGAFLKTNSTDLVFLDIEMPEVNGLEFAKSIPQHTMVIFTTAYPQYALDSYEVEAIDYLLKPISKDRFDKAVNKAAQYLRLLGSQKSTVDSVVEDHVIVKSERRFHKIMFEDILFIAGLRDYVVIYTRTDKILTGMNLKTMHSKLPGTQFIRPSKSYVVNKEAITSFDSSTIYINDHELPIGKTYQAEFYRHFLKK